MKSKRQICNLNAYLIIRVTKNVIFMYSGLRHVSTCSVAYVVYTKSLLNVKLNVTIYVA